MLNKRNVIIFSCIFLSGCMTPYQPHSFMGGYSDMKLSSDLYKVTFSGNGNCSHGRVEKFLFYRSAEIAYREGYPYFAILGANQEDRYWSYTTPASVNTNTQYNYNRWNGLTSNSYSYVHPSQTFASVMPQESVLVKLLKSGNQYPAEIETKVIISQMQREGIKMEGTNVK
jgi:hypothetical protein